MVGRITTHFVGKSALCERYSSTHSNVSFSVWRHLVALKSVGLIPSRDPRSQDDFTCIIFHFLYAQITHKFVTLYFRKIQFYGLQVQIFRLCIFFYYSISHLMHILTSRKHRHLLSTVFLSARDTLKLLISVSCVKSDKYGSLSS
jgi:hypothetical protein